MGDMIDAYKDMAAAKKARRENNLKLANSNGWEKHTESGLITGQALKNGNTMGRFSLVMLGSLSGNE